jgi:PAS domain-containing protein
VRIPLFVSASGVLVLIALGFAWTFSRLTAQYDRAYVREWTRTWLALAVYALAAGLALLSSNLAPLSNARLLFSVMSMAAAWWHLRSLLTGMQELSTPGRRRPLKRVLFVSLTIATAAALAMLPTTPQSDRSLTLYLVRVSLLASAWGVAYGSAGWHILRRQVGTSDVARLTLGCTLVAYAVMRVLEPLTHFLGPRPILAQFLTFGGLPLLVGMGGGMLITLLEVERVRALREAEARAQAERSATASGAALAAALATSTDPVLIVNRDGVVESGNHIFFELSSLATGQRIQTGLQIHTFLNERTRAMWN